MADLPIPFQPPMVRAILREIEQPGSGKTQTRRVLTKLRRFGTIREFGLSDTKGYDWHFRDRAAHWHDLRHSKLLPALSYAVGDRLYVREAWRAARSLDATRPRDIPRDADIEHAATARSYSEIGLKGKLRPGMFMPKWASRLTLIITDVRVQRLQKITYVDLEAEGVVPPRATDFVTLWDSLNARRGFGWDANPWVAAYTFRPILGNIDLIGDAS